MTRSPILFLLLLLAGCQNVASHHTVAYYVENPDDRADMLQFCADNADAKLSYREMEDCQLAKMAEVKVTGRKVVRVVKKGVKVVQDSVKTVNEAVTGAASQDAGTAEILDKVKGILP